MATYALSESHKAVSTSLSSHRGLDHIIDSSRKTANAQLPQGV
jgi:hypothetical protein